jgi:membrane fusion protein, macrolide-specific efflux system
LDWKAIRKAPAAKIAGSIAGIAILAGCGYWLAAAGRDRDAGDVRAVAVARETVEDLVTAQGKLEAKEYVDVGAQVSGQLRKLHVAIGDGVERGALLAEIDPRVYEAQVQANEARLKSLKAQLREQDAQSTLAEQTLARNRGLVAADAISRQVLEQSESEAAVARARIVATKAQMSEVESDLAGIRTNLGFTRILAPMSGTVTTLPAREGQTLNANQTAPILLQISNLGTMTVRAQVAEADVPRLRPGMPAYFTTLGDAERRWEGSVRQILPAPETVNDVVLYNVLIDVPNEDGRLMTGMSAQVFFVLGRAENVAAIPSEALGRRMRKADSASGSAYQVQVLTDAGPSERVIHTGLKSRTRVEVTAGLREGERVVLPRAEAKEGAERPRSGSGGGFGGGRGGRGGRGFGGPVL